MNNQEQRNDKLFNVILEEAFDKYAKDTAAQEPELEMTDEELRAMERTKDIVFNNIMKEVGVKKKKGVRAKVVLPLVAILVLIMACSLNASAIRTFLHQTFMSLVGTDLNFNTKKLMFEDYNNIVNFENKDEIIVPGWLPEGMELEQLKDEVPILTMKFKSEKHWISFKEKSSSDKDFEKIDTEDNKYTILNDKVLNMDCQIVKITSETNLTTHLAYFNSDNLNYSIMTNVSDEDFFKLLKNLQYLEE